MPCRLALTTSMQHATAQATRQAGGRRQRPAPGATITTAPRLGPRPLAAAQPSCRPPRRAVSVLAVAAPGVGRPQAPAAPPPSLPAAPEADSAQQPAGSLFGAVALITGSTVGAGMLALPAVSAPAGIMPTSLSLAAIWGLLTLDALLIAEVNLAARAARDASRAAAAGADAGAPAAAAAGSGIVTLRQMAEFSLGKAGKGFTVIYLALAYSLLTAYCTKAAEVLDFFAGGGLPPLAAAAAFVGGVGGLLYGGGARATDAACQGLTSVLLALFGVILCAGAAQAGLPAALGAAHADWGALPPALPIMFLALVYHDLVPVIVDYLGGDRAAIRSSIVLGSLVPLAMFVSWEAVALSLLPGGLADSAAGGAPLLEAALAGGGGAPAGAAAAAGAPLALDPLDVFVRRSSPLIGSVVEGFSFLAVMTSFIGTALSLSETLRSEVPPLLRDAARKLRAASGAELSADLTDDEAACLAAGGGAPGVAGCSAAWHEREGGAEPPAGGALGGEQRGLALALTLLPPLALAAANPDSFLGALQLAGGYFMTLLYGVLPPVMAWQLREKLHTRQAGGGGGGGGAAARARARGPAQRAWWQQQHEELVPGGPLVLGGLFSAALALELSRLAADAGALAAGAGGEHGGVQGLVEAALLSPSTPEAVAALLAQASALLQL